MEILTKHTTHNSIKVLLMDFDGTISTLRNGWEHIMEPMMLEMISGSVKISDELKEEVLNYIDESTGIQTIYQMKWLAETVKKYGNNESLPDDPWWYKNEYNKRLMLSVQKRIYDIKIGKSLPEEFLMKGSKKFLDTLYKKGIKIYVASGTDDPDVKNEAEILGVKKYFTEIAGAPLQRVDCSKEVVLKKLIDDNKLRDDEICVIGDGKVEIALGRDASALTIGIASDENKLYGINPVKRNRLIKAGAHAIIGDFKDKEEILSWLGIK